MKSTRLYNTNNIFNQYKIANIANHDNLDLGETSHYHSSIINRTKTNFTRARENNILMKFQPSTSSSTISWAETD